MRRDKPSSEARTGGGVPWYARPSEAEQREKLRLDTKAPENARAGGPSQLTQLTQLTGPSLSHKSTAPLSYDTQAR